MSHFHDIEGKEHDKAGFTLLEVLISLTLLTVVLGAVYSSFFSIQRAVERFDTVSLKYHEARTALDLIRREIEGALLKQGVTAGEEAKDRTTFKIRDRDIFGRNTSELSLTAFSFKGYNLNTISYFVEEKDGVLNLLKTEEAFISASKAYPFEVMENIESFTVETLFNNKWVRTWDSLETGSLPDVVRIMIEFDDNGNIVRLIEYAQPKVGNRL